MGELAPQPEFENHDAEPEKLVVDPRVELYAAKAERDGYPQEAARARRQNSTKVLARGEVAPPQEEGAKIYQFPDRSQDHNPEPEEHKEAA